MAYRRHLGLNTGILRIFNTYGPRMRPQDGRVVTSFIAQALSHRPLTIYGDGTQTRSLCYMDDLVRGIVAMIDCAEAGPINLGNPDERTVAEIAELVLNVTNSHSTLEYHPLPTDDPTRRKPDISLATKHLSWRPTVSTEDGVNRTVEFFKSRLESVRPTVGLYGG
jgi:dTDP-glucose 4,6-dehydratase